MLEQLTLLSSGSSASPCRRSRTTGSMAERHCCFISSCVRYGFSCLTGFTAAPLPPLPPVSPPSLSAAVTQAHDVRDVESVLHRAVLREQHQHTSRSNGNVLRRQLRKLDTGPHDETSNVPPLPAAAAAEGPASQGPPGGGPVHVGWGGVAGAGGASRSGFFMALFALVQCTSTSTFTYSACSHPTHAIKKLLLGRLQD